MYSQRRGWSNENSRRIIIGSQIFCCQHTMLTIHRLCFDADAFSQLFCETLIQNSSNNSFKSQTKFNFIESNKMLCLCQTMKCACLWCGGTSSFWISNQQGKSKFWIQHNHRLAIRFRVRFWAEHLCDRVRCTRSFGCECVRNQKTMARQNNKMFQKLNETFVHSMWGIHWYTRRVNASTRCQNVKIENEMHWWKP